MTPDLISVYDLSADLSHTGDDLTHALEEMHASELASAQDAARVLSPAFDLLDLPTGSPPGNRKILLARTSVDGLRTLTCVCIGADGALTLHGPQSSGDVRAFLAPSVLVTAPEPLQIADLDRSMSVSFNLRTLHGYGFQPSDICRALSEAALRVSALHERALRESGLPRRRGRRI